MITLAIETSTMRGHVALLAEGALLLDEHFSADRNHSATLFTVLEKARALVDRVDRIAVGLGPGSFAGVRIAIAAALGLEPALGAQLVGLPSFAALETAAAKYVAIGDARRETFYFTRVEDGACGEGPRLATVAELRGLLAAHAGLPVLATGEVPGFPAVEIALPSAAILARLAAEERGIVARDDLEPIYLREPHITPPRPPRAPDTPLRR